MYTIGNQVTPHKFGKSDQIDRASGTAVVSFPQHHPAAAWKGSGAGQGVVCQGAGGSPHPQPRPLRLGQPLSRARHGRRPEACVPPSLPQSNPDEDVILNPDRFLDFPEPVYCHSMHATPSPRLFLFSFPFCECLFVVHPKETQHPREFLSRLSSVVFFG